MNNNLGKKIVELRTGKNITQDQLASRVGVTRQAISKWERGEGLPDLYNMTKLAAALGVSVDDLLENKETYQNNNNNNEDSDFSKAGGAFKQLLYKAKHTTNSEQAKKIKKYLLIGGGVGLIVGIILVLSGFFGFASGAFNQVVTPIDFEPGMDINDLELPKPFNPIPYMFLFLSGGVVSGISVYVLFAGLSIVIAGATTNYLDTREKCPKCGDAIDSDERSCSNCGYNLEENNQYRCDCGKENESGDKFCRECGNKLYKIKVLN